MSADDCLGEIAPPLLAVSSRCRASGSIPTRIETAPATTRGEALLASVGAPLSAEIESRVAKVLQQGIIRWLFPSPSDPRVLLHERPRRHDPPRPLPVPSRRRPSRQRAVIRREEDIRAGSSVRVPIHGLSPTPDSPLWARSHPPFAPRAERRNPRRRGVIDWRRQRVEASRRRGHEDGAAYAYLSRRQRSARRPTVRAHQGPIRFIFYR